jgi:hypothetical protein
VLFGTLRGMWNPAAPLRLTRKQQSDLKTLISQGNRCATYFAKKFPEKCAPACTSMHATVEP